jgi:hypothetical protein
VELLDDMPFSGVSDPWPSPALEKLFAGLKEGRVLSVMFACPVGVVVYLGAAVCDVAEITKNTVCNVVGFAGIATLAVITPAVGAAVAIPMIPAGLLCLGARHT